MAAKTRTYMDIRNVKEAKPTKKHRAAIWECMLATVYAMNDEGEVRYFDYDWEGAKAWADIDASRDLRVWKNRMPGMYGWQYDSRADKNGLVLFIREAR